MAAKILILGLETAFFWCTFSIQRGNDVLVIHFLLLCVCRQPKCLDTHFYPLGKHISFQALDQWVAIKKGRRETSGVLSNVR